MEKVITSIDQWLGQFRTAWTSGDVVAAASLFADDAEYWETPHKKLQSHADIVHEWQAAQTQHNVQLKLKIFSSTGDKHAVLWDLSYQDQQDNVHQLAGTYLITLNNKGLCTYFHHTGESI